MAALIAANWFSQSRSGSFSDRSILQLTLRCDSRIAKQHSCTWHVEHRIGNIGCIMVSYLSKTLPSTPWAAYRSRLPDSAS